MFIKSSRTRPPPPVCCSKHCASQASLKHVWLAPCPSPHLLASKCFITVSLFLLGNCGLIFPRGHPTLYTSVLRHCVVYSWEAFCVAVTSHLMAVEAERWAVCGVVWEHTRVQNGPPHSQWDSVALLLHISVSPANDYKPLWNFRCCLHYWMITWTKTSSSQSSSQTAGPQRPSWLFLVVITVAR